MKLISNDMKKKEKQCQMFVQFHIITAEKKVAFSIFPLIREDLSNNNLKLRALR